MKSDPWTLEFDGFEKPRGRCRIAAAGIRTRAPQQPLAFSGRWSSMWVLSASLPAVVGFSRLDFPAAAQFKRSLGSIFFQVHRSLCSIER
ncbi:hypothetical protein C2S51_027999 [Perilla frutescens var. frutescens]|nr:hypothetical protein C2S51_027999 [Perilla frutescens var. frutescens]